MKMSVGVLDHCNVSTRKLNETVRFYEDVLGFMNGPRPAFDFPGAWLYSAGHPVLHLNDISQTDKQQRPDSGVIDHVAFGCRGFQAMKQHLTGKGVPHHVNQVPNSARWQIFLRDPNNIEIELNFETKNETAAEIFGSPVLNPRVAKLKKCSGQKQAGGPTSTIIWKIFPPQRLRQPLSLQH